MISNRYAAFLRGINVGGKNIVRMSDLRRALEAAGCVDVATVLASGNVVFGSADPDAAAARARVERSLEAVSDRPITALVRTMEHVRALAARNPFAGIEVTPDTRLYVTFFPEPPVSNLALPHQAPRGGLTLLEMTETELYSVLQLSVSGTAEVMSMIEREFGRGVTTRNWQTVLKVAAVGS